MRKTKNLFVWTDLRNSVTEYSAQELLLYYRTSMWYAGTAERIDDAASVTIHICRVVDYILDAMKSIPEYRAVIFSDILHVEYCEEQIPAANKIAKFEISKTTYYSYLKQGEAMFEGIYKQFVERNIICRIICLDGAAGSDDCADGSEQSSTESSESHHKSSKLCRLIRYADPDTAGVYHIGGQDSVQLVLPIPIIPIPLKNNPDNLNAGSKK